MVVLKVLGEGGVGKIIVLEKEDVEYNASNLFFKLDYLDLKNTEGSTVLYSESLDYNENSVKDRNSIIEEILKLNKEYGVHSFNNKPSTLRYWAYMNGVSKVSNSIQ